MFGEKAAPAPNRNWTKTQTRTAERRPYLQKKRLFFLQKHVVTQRTLQKIYRGQFYIGLLVFFLKIVTCNNYQVSQRWEQARKNIKQTKEKGCRFMLTDHLPVRNWPKYQRAHQKTCHVAGLWCLNQATLGTNQTKLKDKKMMGNSSEK